MPIQENQPMRETIMIKKTLMTGVLGLATSFFAVTTYADTFTLSSSDISGQLTKTQEFTGFGCSGNNLSPALQWKNAPAGTKSFAVTVHDIDAPTAPLGKGGFWHWNIFNIPSSVTSLEAGAGDLKSGKAPKGSIQGVTSFGVAGFGGPCPPKGDNAHAYIFTVYALKTDNLGLDKNATPAVVGFMLGQNTIQKASLISYYER